MQFICSAEEAPRGLFNVGVQNTEGQKHFARVLIGDLDIAVVRSFTCNFRNRAKIRATSRGPDCVGDGEVSQLTQHLYRLARW